MATALKAPRQWFHNGLPLACAEQFCRARPVRAPKAEHWLSARPSASKNGAATGQESERIVLPLTFHTEWLVKGLCFAHAFHG